MCEYIIAFYLFSSTSSESSSNVCLKIFSVQIPMCDVKQVIEWRYTSLVLNYLKISASVDVTIKSEPLKNLILMGLSY